MFRWYMVWQYNEWGEFMREKLYTLCANKVVILSLSIVNNLNELIILFNLNTHCTSYLISYTHHFYKKEWDLKYGIGWNSDKGVSQHKQNINNYNFISLFSSFFFFVFVKNGKLFTLHKCEWKMIMANLKLHASSFVKMEKCIQTSSF